MGYLTEKIKGAAHVHFSAGAHIQQGQVDRASTAMGGLARDIASLEQLLLFQIRIKIWLHAQIQILNAPQNEMPHRPGRTVGVINLQPIALYIHLIGHSFERSGCFFCQKCNRLFITVYPLAHKIVGGVIADLLYNARNIIGQKHKA